ncbi:hypothetical protein X741_05705 [Mesorhizobium sp. LNHC229A00]|nr:hypothetical protein X741_05705 [Mesorhizobium sp. LNHC229A00]
MRVRILPSILILVVVPDDRAHPAVMQRPFPLDRRAAKR